MNILIEITIWLSLCVNLLLFVLWKRDTLLNFSVKVILLVVVVLCVVVLDKVYLT